MFLKDVVLPTGVVVGCWIVEKISLNFIEHKAEVRALGYLSSEAKEAGKDPIHDIVFNISADSAQELAVAALAFAEARVQLDPFFPQEEE